MAEGYNKAVLVGNLGADPELRYAGEQPVLNMRIATSESYKDKNGERVEKTEWHNVAMWGKRGEALSKFLVKGSRVLVEGRIETRTYDNKDGVKCYATSINATNLVMMDSKKDSEGRPQGDGDQRAQGNGQQQSGNGQRQQQQGQGNAQRPAQRPAQRQQSDDFGGGFDGGGFGGGGRSDADDSDTIPF